MAENSKITWTHHTFNPWMGCTKVSPACQNCYAERDMDHRWKRVKWGPQGTRVVTSESNWNQPVKWNKQSEWFCDSCKSFCFNFNGKCRGCGNDCRNPNANERLRVFCASLADVFEEWDGSITNSNGEVLFIANSDGYWCIGNSPRLYTGWNHEDIGKVRPKELTMANVRQRLFSLIDSTPNLDWLLLTKRPENIRKMWKNEVVRNPNYMSAKALESGAVEEEVIKKRENVFLGTTVENQEYADKRIPELLKCRDLAKHLFLSCEPLLGPIELSAHSGIDWVITGSESGPNKRDVPDSYYESLAKQCSDSAIPFFMKQINRYGVTIHDMSMFPESLRFQQFPT